MPEDIPKKTDAPRPDGAQEQSVPKLENGGVPYKLDFLVALISLLFPFGWSVSGFPPSIILACFCWATTLFTFLHFFWNWSRNTGRARILRWLVVLGLPVFILVIAWRPVVNQYHIQHPVVPMLVITIRTIPGLPGGMTNTHLRYHMLEIRNYNDMEIDDFYSRLQLPEQVITTIETDLPPGTVIGWQPFLTRYSITGTGNKSLLGPASARHYLYPAAYFFPGNRAQLTGFSDGSDMTGVWQLTFNKLPPHGVVSLSFLTTSEGDATNYIGLVNYEFKTNGATFTTTMQGTNNGGSILHNLMFAMIVHTNKVVEPNEDWRLGTNELRFYFEGSYQYPAVDKPGNQHFLVPFVFDTNNLTISSLPTQPEDGKWRRVMIQYQ